MNLSTLTGPELRSLLDTARARGQAQLSYQILQEMEARRAAPRGLFRMRRGGAEPRELVLDGPQEAAAPEDDIPPMPMWTPPVREPAAAAKPKPKPDRTPSRPPSRRRKPAAAVAAAEPQVAPPAPPPEPEPPEPEPPRPRSVWDAEPEPLPAPARLPLRAPKRTLFSRTSAAVFAAGLAAGVVLGAGVAGMRREAPAPAPAPVQTAALAPPPAPVAPPVAEPEPAPTPEASDLAAEAASPPPDGAAVPSPDAAPEEAGPALELPREPEPAEEAAVAVEAPRDACAGRATPADRAICGDPELQRLQRQLRRAYANALDAHEDRDLLRQRQLAWRDARSSVSNPDRLARLYEDRIRRLNAATEAAKRAR